MASGDENGPGTGNVVATSPRRVELRALLQDPVRKHRLLVSAGITLQRREGRDVSPERMAVARLRILPRREAEELLDLLPEEERKQLLELLKGESCSDS